MFSSTDVSLKYKIRLLLVWNCLLVIQYNLVFINILSAVKLVPIFFMARSRDSKSYLMPTICFFWFCFGLYIYIYIYVYTYMYIDMYIYIYIYIYTYLYTYIYMYIYIYLYIYIYIYIYIIYVCIHLKRGNKKQN